MTTLITAAKETINHDDLPKNRGLFTYYNLVDKAITKLLSN